MPDKKLTDAEIVKAKELIKKLEDAYNAYYDTSRCMPYDIDTTLRETAICLENCLNEINRLQAEKEALINGQETLQKYIAKQTTEIERLRKCRKEEVYKIVSAFDKVICETKAEAYKEFAEEIFELFPADKPNTVISRVTVKHILKEKVGEDTKPNDVKCIDCEHLELSLPYGVCSKEYKMVNPDDSCGKGKLKEEGKDE